MDEISSMKEKITNIFETNGKVLQVLQKCEAINNSDEAHGRRIHDLKDSLQRLRKRTQERHNKFQELEEMTRDLGLKLERAATIMRTYKDVVNRDRRQSEDLDIKVDGRESDLQPIVGSSNSPLRRDKNMTKSVNVTPKYKEQMTLSEPYISHKSIDEHRRKQMVTFTDDSDKHFADRQQSSQIWKDGLFSSNENVEDSTSHVLQSAAEIPVNNSDLKQKLTKNADDYYENKSEMSKRRNKQKANVNKNENCAVGNDVEVVPSNITDGTKDEDMMKQEVSLHGLAKSPGTAISRSLTRPALKEKYEHAIEQPDHMQQKEQQPMDTMLQDKIDVTTAIKEMADRAKTELLKGEEEKLPRGDGPDTVLCLDTSGSMKGVAFREMISLATKFVDGIQRVSQQTDIKENIAVSTFGKKPGVPIHLTNQYNKVTEVLRTLKPEGQSPMLEGIYMALAASKGNTAGRQNPTGINGIIFGARIILISDGKVTPDQWRLNEDMIDLDDIEATDLVNSNMIAAINLLRSYGNTLYLVPVGDYTEGPLQRIASLSGGEVIKNRELDRLIQHAQFHTIHDSRIGRENKKHTSEDDINYLLHVTGVNFNFHDDCKAHHTDKYSLTEQQSGKDQFLVLRRGQPFQITLNFDQPYDQQQHELELIFETGTYPVATKGTRVEMFLSAADQHCEWRARLLEQKDLALTLEVITPPSCIIGRWHFKIKTFKKTNMRPSNKIYSHPQPVYILFNPWCKEDQVYLHNDGLLEEYVLGDTGRIFKGNAKDIYGKPWNFAQFDDPVLDCVLDLLNNFPASNRGDPIKIVRKLTALVNTSNENRILIGNWSGNYEGGKKPTAWTGSQSILEEYHKTKLPVKFGQCWVFSGILTTCCRTLGIPTRSVTNFASAHDTDISVSIDYHFDEDGNFLDYMNTDSVWNFHVRNDVWMARPDLKDQEYGGWQACDSTPKETSDGPYSCGPCPLLQIAPLVEKVARLEAENDELRHQLDDLEQYGRRTLVLFSGFPEQTGEDTSAIILKAAEDCGVDLPPQALERSHRVGKPDQNRGKPRQIIARLNSVDAKFALLKSSRGFRSKDTFKGISVNEDLTRYRGRLACLARNLLKADLILQTWTTNGKIMIKDKSSKIIQIRRESELEPFGHQM
ncbi:uncharacterized protein LOC117333912 [Pecten maximus]|uniref:uncharacterized protein LOC117333912 n=1 Tax=Pecten maximus TaxID=6579 RepID=UPI0014586B69|nr:uncharacterized protein LOC117333912 [Pecten maximus]